MAINMEDFQKFLGEDIPDDMIKSTLFLTMYKLQWELMQAMWSFIEEEELMKETYKFFIEKNESIVNFNMTLTGVFCKLLAEYDVEKMKPNILLQMYFDMLNAEVANIKGKATTH